MTTRKHAVSVRLTGRERAALTREAKQRKTSVAAVIRERLHRAGAPGALRERRVPATHVSLKVSPATYAWATEQAAAAGVSVSAFLGGAAGRRNARPRR